MYAAYIRQIIQGIDRGSTKIGTGLGTWNSAAFVAAECALPIDFISLHIYPIDRTSVSTAFQAAAIARAAGKEVIIDEAWLYKARPGEVTDIASNADVFKRDAYSLFAPLDQQFIRFADGFSRAEGVTMVSMFWTQFLFAYLALDPAMESLTYAQIVQLENTVAAQNIIAGRLSPTGDYYRSRIAGE